MIPELGLIEGFFGRPWDWEDRHAAARFLGPRGYGFYLYAPKADASLRRFWREPLPAGTQENLAALAATCRDSGMRLGVGLTPFELHLHPESDWRGPLAAKVSALDEAGIDDLAILFDDMRGDIPDLAERQAAIIGFVAERTKASRILCCPTYYSDDPVLDRAFGERPPFYLEELGRLLDPAIALMWTGEEVVSRAISPGHVARVGEAMRRRPFLWDNYPVNDGPLMARHLHLRAFTGRSPGLAPLVEAHGINLASQPWLSRIPALTLVESYGSGEAYEYGAAFDRAAREVLGEKLADRVRRDLLALQDRGLDALGDRTASLREIYGGFDHPAAAEILAWLDERWAVTGELVETQ